MSFLVQGTASCVYVTFVLFRATSQLIVQTRTSVAPTLVSVPGVLQPGPPSGVIPRLDQSLVDCFSQIDDDTECSVQNQSQAGSSHAGETVSFCCCS